MEQLSTASINLAKGILAATVLVVLWRAATLPVTGAEVEAWNAVVRPPAAALLTTPGDWSGLVYGLLARRAAGVFRLSEFSLRFPGVLGCILFCCGVDRICRSRIWLLLAFIIPPIVLNWFNLAGGAGLAIGLSAFGAAYPATAGLTLGLAVAACPQIGFVPAMAAAALLYQVGVRRGLERILIPAIAIGFVLLILPLSHGGKPLPTPGHPTTVDAAVRSAVAVLRTEAGKGTTPLFASPSAAGLLDFYRARYRQRNWVPGDPNPAYFLWVTPDRPPSSAPRQVLFEQNGVVLAR